MNSDIATPGRERALGAPRLARKSVTGATRLARFSAYSIN
jgi:hypothetical protein